MWKYFTKFENKKVQCKILVQRDGKEVPCDIAYKFTGSTSNLNLNIVHGKTEADEEVVKVNIILLKIIIIKLKIKFVFIS